MVLLRVNGQNPERPDPAPAATWTDDVSRDAYTSVRESREGLPEHDPSRYEVIAEHGQGGLGRVLRVRDRDLERVVAVKELLHRTNVAEQRFEREAKISARLQHPNIVPIYEAGRWPSGKPFYSMKLVEGRSLRDAIRACESFAERLALLPHVLAVAEAIAYAHSKGIIHRDLKPANVITGAFGETVVIDWGLAKDTREGSPGDEVPATPYREGADDGLTRTGEVVGTPAYMAPEQARGEAVDERADVYALGAMLYHVLTGKLPFTGADSREVLKKVMTATPATVREHEPDAPDDLVAIVTKAMARRPESRYRSAKELAEDLRRFQTGKLVSAHDYSRWQLVNRWVRRNRVPVAVASIAAVLLIALGAISVRRIIAERDAARTSDRAAQAARRQAMRERDELVLHQAQTTLSSDPTTAVAWLKHYQGADLTRARALALSAQAHGVARRVLDPHSNTQALQLAFDPTGAVISVGSDRQVRRWAHDATSFVMLGAHTTPFFAIARDTGSVVFASQREILIAHSDSYRVRSIGTFVAPLASLAMDPKGTFAVGGSTDGSVQLWATAGSHHEALQHHAGGVYWVAVTASGRFVISTGVDGVARAADREQGTQRVLGPAAEWSRVAVSAAGEHVVWSGPGGEVMVQDLVSGRHRRFETGASLAGPFAFSNDGRFIAAGLSTKEMLIIDLASNEPAFREATASRVYAMEFSPAGAFAFADRMGTHILDLLAGTRTKLRDGHIARSLAFSPDGRILATAGSRGDIRFWDVDRPFYRLLQAEPEHVLAGRYIPARSTLATGGRDGIVRLWSVADWSFEELKGPTGQVNAIEVSSDGRFLAAASMDGGVYVWDLDSRTPKMTVRAHGAAVWELTFVGAGSLVSVSMDGDARFTDLETSTSSLLNPDAGAIRDVVAVGGHRVVALTMSGQLRSWDTSEAMPHELHSTAPRSFLALAPAGEQEVVALTSFGRFGRWSPDTGTFEVIGSSSQNSASIAAGNHRWVVYDRTTVGHIHAGDDPEERSYVAAAPIVGAADRMALDGPDQLWFLTRNGVASALSPSGQTAIWFGSRNGLWIESLAQSGLMAVALEGGRVAVVGHVHEWSVPDEPELFSRWLRELTDAETTPSTEAPETPTDRIYRKEDAPHAQEET